MIKDEFQAEEKQVKNMNDLGFIPLPPVPLSNTKGWQDKSVASDNVRVENGNFLLADQDAIVRFFAGRNIDGIWEVVMSKSGVDARLANNSQVLFSSNVIFFEHIVVSAANIVTNANVLLGVHYDVGSDANYVQTIALYKESDWTITEAILRVRIIGDPVGTSAKTNLTNVSVRLNPTRTTIPALGAPFTEPYYRYSAGTVITSGLAVTVAQGANEDHDYTLDSSQIAAITNGWNDIVIQQDADDLSGWNIFTASLVIRGYVNL